MQISKGLQKAKLNLNKQQEIFKKNISSLILKRKKLKISVRDTLCFQPHHNVDTQCNTITS